ncbi:MAG: hypothetical protein ACP5VS_17685, partial [Desulfomonilaceae bacterium]
SGAELVDLLESLDSDTIKVIIPRVQDVLGKIHLEFEDLKNLVSLPDIDQYGLLGAVAPPQLDGEQALAEFRDGSLKMRKILFHSCRRAEFFADLFFEAWAMDPKFVRREVASFSSAEIGPFIDSLSSRANPKFTRNNKGEFEIEFLHEELNNFYKSLPAGKKKAVKKFFLGRANQITDAE